MDIESFGLHVRIRNFSVLHAEMEELFWMISCIRDMKIPLIRFQMDCSDKRYDYCMD